MSVQVVVEGSSDIPIATKLVEDAGLEVARTIDLRGKAEIDARLDGFNQAAKHSPWFVMRDLDRDASCAPAFLRQRRFQPSRWMVFRLAVREVESWLLADGAALAKFLAVPVTAIPLDPDALEDPKQALVNLARRSRRREVREGMVPQEGRSAVVGPLYVSEIIDFGTNHWSLARAAKSSPSLSRARAALRTLATRWQRPQSQ